MFRISEEDLAVLESETPRLMEASGEALNRPIVRRGWEMVKNILSNVRWEYGPPLEVQRLTESE